MKLMLNGFGAELMVRLAGTPVEGQSPRGTELVGNTSLVLAIVQSNVETSEDNDIVRVRNSFPCLYVVLISYSRIFLL